MSVIILPHPSPLPTTNHGLLSETSSDDHIGKRVSIRHDDMVYINLTNTSIGSLRMSKFSTRAHHIFSWTVVESRPSRSGHFRLSRFRMSPSKCRARFARNVRFVVTTRERFVLRCTQSPKDFAQKPPSTGLILSPTGHETDCREYCIIFYHSGKLRTELVRHRHILSAVFDKRFCFPNGALSQWPIVYSYCVRRLRHALSIRLQKQFEKLINFIAIFRYEYIYVCIICRHIWVTDSLKMSRA